jgi:hypothetical protein
MTSVSWNSTHKSSEDRVAMERFLDDVGWAALLITVGALWLVPAGQLPQGTWMIAVGLILLVLNLARYVLRIHVNWFTLIAGTVALLAGIGAYLAVDPPIFPIALVLIGVCLLLGSFRKNLQRSHDQEHGVCC